MLAEDLSRALHDTAMQLAFDNRVIDHGAAVIDGAVRDDFRLACFSIDLDLDNVTAVGEC